MVLSNVFSILYSESFMLNKKAVYSGLISEVYTPKQKYFENHTYQKIKNKNKKKRENGTCPRYTNKSFQI